jgi:hypothetical protein
MSDLAPILSLHAPPPQSGGLPRHLYGTRAALFHLLRETADPLRPAPPPVALPALPPVARIVPFAPPPAPPARAALGDLLQSDSFDFRGPGDPA